jgi:hypothetical protein
METIPKHKLDPKTIFWIEATPVYNGGYCCGSSEDENGIATPAVDDTKAEAEEDRKYMEDEWKRQIAAGERDEDDEWDGEIFPCRVIGGIVELLDEDTIGDKEPSVVDTIDWTESL